MAEIPQDVDVDMIGRFRSEVIVPEPQVKDDPSPADLGILEAKLEPAKQAAASHE